MADVNDLVARINAEFSAHREQASQLRSEHMHEHKDRQQRFESLEAIFDRLRDVWRPRLEALAAQFKDSVKITPAVAPGQRRAMFEFQSPLARIRLQLSASTDSEVKKVVLAYDLEILPIYTVAV
jgi:hypothetical protein